MLSKIRDVEELLLADTAPTIEDIMSANRLARESGLIGRPVVSGCVDFVGVYDKEQGTLKTNQLKQAEGLHYGKFLRFYIASYAEISDTGIDERMTPYVLFQDFEDETEVYGSSIGEVPTISDVMAALEDDHIALQAEAVLADDNPNLVELSKVYQKIQSFDCFYLAQLTAHIQYLLRVSDICNSVVAASETRIYKQDGSYQLSCVPPMNCVVDDFYLPVIASSVDECDSSLVFYTHGRLSDGLNYNRSLILDDTLNGYCRANTLIS